VNWLAGDFDLFNQCNLTVNIHTTFGWKFMNEQAIFARNKNFTFGKLERRYLTFERLHVEDRRKVVFG
jgi:hypothetical protein